MTTGGINKEDVEKVVSFADHYDIPVLKSFDSWKEEYSYHLLSKIDGTVCLIYPWAQDRKFVLGSSRRDHVGVRFKAVASAKVHSGGTEQLHAV